MKLFICHASEDKDPFANTLVSSLEHLNYFYDIYSLKIGDEISEVINEEIQKSTGAIVIISSSFLRKDYPKSEFKLITHKKMSNDDYKIFPIFLGDIEQESKEKFPILNNLWCAYGESEKTSAQKIAQDILNKLKLNTGIKELESLEIDCKKIIESLSQVKDWNEVLSKRYGIGYRYLTLREIGEEFHLTRERIRQREEKAEETLREFCQKDSFLRKITDKILSKCIIADDVSIITLKDIIASIKYRASDDVTIKQVLKLILNIHGYMELRSTYGVNTIFIKCDERIMNVVEIESGKVIDYLRYKNAIPVKLDFLKEVLELNLSTEILSNLLDTYEFIEKDKHLFYVKFSDLGKLSAMAERIIFENKTPSKADALLESIRLKSLNDPELLNKLNLRLLIQQMSSEKERFFSNKKGFWGISENRNDIVEYRDLLLGLLEKHEVPVERKVLLHDVLNLNIDERGKRSIRVYLTNMKEIKCLIKINEKKNATCYILSKYTYDEKLYFVKQKRILKKPRVAEQLNIAIIKIRDYYRLKAVDNVFLKDLVKYLQKEMKLRRKELAYGYIKKSELLDYSQDVSRNMLVKLK